MFGCDYSLGWRAISQILQHCVGRSYTCLRAAYNRPQGSWIKLQANPRPSCKMVRSTTTMVPVTSVLIAHSLMGTLFYHFPSSASGWGLNVGTIPGSADTQMSALHKVRSRRFPVKAKKEPDHFRGHRISIDNVKIICLNLAKHKRGSADLERRIVTCWTLALWRTI
jgi:hypothetical protein